MLVSEYGCDLPATGFAVGIKRLLIAMEQQGCLEEFPGLMFIDIYGRGRGKAYRVLQQLKNEGKRVEMFLPLKSAVEPMTYARQKGITQIINISGSGIKKYNVD